MDLNSSEKRRSDQPPQAANSTRLQPPGPPEASSSSSSSKFFIILLSNIEIFIVGLLKMPCFVFFPNIPFLGSQPKLKLPFFAMTKFTDVRVNVDISHMDYYWTGTVPAHHKIYYEPKVIKVRNTNHMVMYRYDADSGRMRWKILRRPLIRNRTDHHTVDLSRVNLDLDKPVPWGFENGEKVWTNQHCRMEDVLSWLRYYDITRDGKLYAAVPGKIPVMSFGRQCLPYPPIEGILL